MLSLPYYHYESHPVNCTHCGWKGLGNQLIFGEMFNALFELDCPKCDQKLAMVGYPSFEEVLKYGSEAEKAEIRRIKQKLEDHKNQELTLNTPLPKLTGLQKIRFEERYELNQRVILDIYANDHLIFSEEVYYEYSERLMEIIKILDIKYRGRIQSIEVESTFDLCGDRFDSRKLKALIEKVSIQPLP